MIDSKQTRFLLSILIKKAFILFSIFGILLQSCQNAEIDDSQDNNLVKAEDKPSYMDIVEIEKKTLENGRISPDLDLNNTQMLHYKQLNGVVRDLIPFWGSGGSVAAEQNIRFDKSPLDGWVVVYNQFVTDETIVNPVLVLYNKYRGILRWWWFNDNQTLIPSSKLSFGLAIEGNANSMFNFQNELVRHNNVNFTKPYVLSSVNQQGSSGLAPNTWYYFDTEFAYDPKVKNKPQSNYGFALTTVSSSENPLTLTGDVGGTINGILKASGNNINLSIDNLFQSVKTANNIAHSNVVFDNGTKAKNSLDNKFNLGLGGILTSVLKGELSKLATQGLQFLTNPLSTMLSSLVSSKQGANQSVELKLAAKINLNGQSVSTTPVKFFKSAIPGTARGDNSGFLPFYNEPLGVFSLSSQPVVNFKQVYTSYPPDPNLKEIQYLVSTNLPFVLNPAIANEVTVQPPSVRLIYLRTYNGKEPLSSNGNSINSSASFQSFGSPWPVINNVMGNHWVGFSAPYVVKYNYFSGTPEDNIVVHVTWKIVPNNGSDPIEIVKMFKPQFIPG